MRAIIYSLIIVLAFQTSHASSSFIENLADWSSIELEKQSSFEGRKQVLDRTQDILAKKIGDEGNESLMNLAPEDPRVENFRTLLEFQGYLDLIANSALKISCKDSELNLKNSAVAPISEVSNVNQLKELQLALKIQRALCKSNR